MAITRAQQYKQMLQDGGRIGLKNGPAGGASALGNYGGDRSGGKTANEIGRGYQGPGRDDRVDVGFQEALRKEEIAKKKKQARDEGFRTTGSVKYSPPTFFENIRNRGFQSGINRNKVQALRKMGLLDRSLPGFFGQFISGMTGKVPDWAKDMTEEELNALASDIQGIKDYGQATYNVNLNPDKKGSGSELLGRTFDAQDLLDKGEMTQTDYDTLFPGPTITKTGDGGDQGDPCRGPNPPAYCFTGIRSAAPVVEEPEEEVFTPNLRLLAEGGRAGFNMGGAQFTSGSNISPGTDVKGNVRDDNPFRGGDGPPRVVTPSGGDGGPTLTSKKDIPVPSDFSKLNFADLINFNLINQENEKSQPLFADASLNQDELNIQKALNQKTYTDAIKEVLPGGEITAGGEITNTVPDLSNPDVLNKIAIDAGLPTEKKGIIGSRKDVATPKSSNAIKSIQNLKRNPDLKFSLDDVIETAPVNPTLKDLSDEQIKNIYNVVSLPNQNRFTAAEGGMPYEGGIMDLESARQMYGLGKLVKKVTRGIKKIVKSPIGKAAIIGGLTFGIPGVQSGFFSKGLMGTQKGLGLRKFLTDSIFGKVTDLGIAGPNRAARTGGLLNFLKDNPLMAIGGASALAGLYTAKTEDEEPLYAGADIDDPRKIMANPYKYLNIRNMAEGGSTEKEPVAKKTMPLLDMGGMEKDYREEGGFVPIGRMEKADDVPARLSKNEFVFTADAVRNAGDGDVDLGAEKMYNMMKNLEAGGDVSEESQGLEGAREMFQTSKRLEEVL